MSKTWLFVMILICLVLAAVVYAAPTTIILEPGDEAYVKCVDDIPLAIERRGNEAGDTVEVVVYCAVVPVIPPPVTDPAPQQTPRPTPTAPIPGSEALLPVIIKEAPNISATREATR